jgi:hypothetical protein
MPFHTFVYCRNALDILSKLSDDGLLEIHISQKCIGSIFKAE